MKEVKAIVRPDRLADVMNALRQIAHMPGVTVSVVRGFARHAQPSSDVSVPETEFAKIEAVIPSAMTTQVVAAIRDAACTSRPGDGKIFVLPVELVTRISTGDEGEGAI